MHPPRVGWKPILVNARFSPTYTKGPNAPVVFDHFLVQCAAIGNYQLFYSANPLGPGAYKKPGSLRASLQHPFLETVSKSQLISQRVPPLDAFSYTLICL